MPEIVFKQVGQAEDGTPIFGKPDERPSLLRSTAHFVAGQLIGITVFIGVGSVIVAICPPLLPVLIIGAACMRDY